MTPGGVRGGREPAPAPHPEGIGPARAVARSV